MSEAKIEAESAGFDLLGSNVDLTGAEIELLSMDRREFRLKAALMPVQASYDYIVIDCPPSLSLLTINGLVASDTAMIPMQCEYYALEGLSALINTISRITASLNPDLEVEVIVRTRYDLRISMT